MIRFWTQSCSTDYCIEFCQHFISRVKWADSISEVIYLNFWSCIFIQHLTTDAIFLYLILHFLEHQADSVVESIW